MNGMGVNIEIICPTSCDVDRLHELCCCGGAAVCGPFRILSRVCDPSSRSNVFL